MTVCALLSILTPYVVGLSIAHGVAEDAKRSIDIGGNLYVSGAQFGRPAPLSLDLVDEFRELSGVTRVVPRIIGRLTLGADHVEAVAVGVPSSELPTTITCIEGRLPNDAGTNEFVVGSELARRLNLRVGSLMPPFYRNRSGEHVSEIVGVFDSDVALWQSHMLCSTLGTMEKIFDQQNLATDIVIYCRTGQEELVASAVKKIGMARRNSGATNADVRVTSRQTLDLILVAARGIREGIFNLHFVLMFIIGLLVLMVTTGVGLTERRREIGIMKATGWQTDELLFKSLVEAILISLTAASISVLIAFFWLRVLNGWGVAAVFLPGATIHPAFTVPFRLVPIPILVACVVSLSVTMSGSIWSSWRAASVDPSEAMR